MLYSIFVKNNEVLINNTKLNDLLHLEMNHYSADTKYDFEIKTIKDIKKITEFILSLFCGLQIVF